MLGVRTDEDAAPFGDLLAAVGFTGKADQLVTVPAGDLATATSVVAVALPAEPTAAQLRAAAARGVRAAQGGTVALALQPAGVDEAAAIAEGARLGAYRYSVYKKAPAGDAPDRSVTALTVLTPFARQSSAQKAFDRATVVTDAVAAARDWVNAPPADLRPADFAEAITAFAGSDVTVKVWDEKRLAKENCGGILGVGRGSDAPPRLVTLTYSPAKPTTHLALVGKGITFDSGGLSIKSGSGMKTMKCDMAGAAAVVAATVAIAKLGLPIKVTAYACLAENMPSGDATRPGDVLTIRNGATVEIHNTDAEGRLVLADGLSLAVESGADRILDVATLTGACVVALGDRTSGVLGVESTVQEVLDAAAVTGESMWPLPIPAEIRARVRTSSIADLLQHNPKPSGGTLFAAAFLEAFVGDVPWAHLDIAGPSFNEGSAYDEIPVGGTGAAVRTLVEYASRLS